MLYMPNNDFRKALDSVQELELTFTGRKSGKKFSIPIWFAASGNKLYLLPVGGTKSKWYRSVLKNPTIELSASGKKAKVEAHTTEDKKSVEDTMGKFRAKYGNDDVKKYYPGQNAAVELTI